MVRWSTTSGWRGSEGNAGSWPREAMAANAAGCGPGWPCVAAPAVLTRSSYECIQDRTADGGTGRILSIIDEYTRGNACCSKPPAASRHDGSSMPWRRSWSAVGANHNTFVATMARSSWPSRCKVGSSKLKSGRVTSSPAHHGNQAKRDSLPKAARRMRQSRSKTPTWKASMPKCAWNCWMENSSATCAKSMRRPATTPTNTTSNDRTAAWTKVSCLRRNDLMD